MLSIGVHQVLTDLKSFDACDLVIASVVAARDARGF
jgi:hypothetical protein